MAHPNKIYVGKVPLEFDQQTLKDYFSKFGEVKEVVSLEEE